MKTITCLLIILVLFGTSCKSLLVSYYKIGREMKYTERKDYQKYLDQKFPEFDGNFYYVDKNHYPDFATDLPERTRKTSHVFFGFYTNDSTAVVITDTLSFSSGCVGKIDKAIDSVVSLNSVPVYLDTSLSRFRFITLSTNSSLKTNDAKLNVIVYYFYPFGKMYDSFYKDLERMKLKNKDKIELHMVVIDNVSELK